MMSGCGYPTIPGTSSWGITPTQSHRQSCIGAGSDDKKLGQFSAPEEKQVRIAQMIYVLIYKEHEEPTEHKGNRRKGTEKSKHSPIPFVEVKENYYFLQRKRIS